MNTDPERDDGTMDRIVAGETEAIRTARTYHEKFPLDQAVIIPEENYRWGSVQGMEADLEKMAVREDGTPYSTFNDLCDSLRVAGMREPVGFVLRADGKHHPIYGFTRCVAAAKIGMTHVPAYVYDANITSAEVELLQLMENSPDLKRRVNWVREVEMFEDLVTRFRQRLRETGATGDIRMQAVNHVAKLLGRGPSVMRSRAHWLKNLDPRVRKLAEEDRISVVAARALIGEEGQAKNAFDKEFLTAVLGELSDKKTGAFPKIIAPKACRDAVRKVKISYTQRISAEERDLENINRAQAKSRQSPAVLRDCAILIARDLLRKHSITLSSPTEHIESLTKTQAWFEIRGMGVGAGDALAPPVLEHIVGGREREQDAVVDRMYKQHDLSCHQYATSIFVQAFIHDELAKRGVRLIGTSDDASWMAKITTIGDRKVINSTVYHEAVNEAVYVLSKGGKAVPLGARLARAWELVRPVVEASTVMPRQLGRVGA